MPHSTWPGISTFANSTAPKHTTVCRWQTTSQYRCWLLTIPSRRFAYRRLAQGLSRLLSAFSSFMREYLDKAIKVDQCAQYVDDIGIAANDSTQFCINIRTVFECIRKAGLKLTMAKCHFGVKQFDFLGRTITPEEFLHKPKKSNNSFRNSNSRSPKKPFNGIMGFLTTTEITFLVYQKSFRLSSNCSKQHHSSVYETQS